jgi:uncharacterized phiE125 gp8 family phage protein
MLSPRTVTPTADADLTVTLDDAKKFLVVDHSDDDADISALLRTAYEFLQPPFGCLRVSIAPQTLRLDAPCWPTCSIELPAGPVQSITSVKYFDEDNVEQTLASSEYFLDNDTLMWATSFSAPSIYLRPSAVRITYLTGYAADALPAVIRTAILQAVKHWYDNRDIAQVVGPEQMMALGIDDLIHAYRVR